jgi:hypothetical protein
MLLTDITRIVRALVVTLETVAVQDDLTKRRLSQIGEVIGAVDDVAADEAETDATIAAKRVEEAHDIIHRIAAILAMEEGRDDEPLAEVAWDGKIDGETIELTDAGEE